MSVFFPRRYMKQVVKESEIHVNFMLNLHEFPVNCCFHSNFTLKRSFM